MTKKQLNQLKNLIDRAETEARTELDRHSASKLAALTGMNRGTIHRIKNGTRPMNTGAAIAILEGLQGETK